MFKKFLVNTICVLGIPVLIVIGLSAYLIGESYLYFRRKSWAYRMLDSKYPYRGC